MREFDHLQGNMLSYSLPEQTVQKDHPLRAARVMTDEILQSMSPLFYANVWRAGAAVDSVRKVAASAQLPQMLYWVRSERLLMAEID